MIPSASTPPERNYVAQVLGELPGAEHVRYFPDVRSEAPLLVRFTLPDGASWVGGFGGGSLASYACSGVFPSPSPSRACIVSHGRAYLVDVAAPEATTVLVPELVMQAVPCAAAGLLLLTDPWEVRGYGADGLIWSTGRIAVEGVTVVSVDERTVAVRVEDAEGGVDERRIDLRTGHFV